MHSNTAALIILAGGLGSRMGHVTKAFLDVGGKPIIERLMDELAPGFGEVIISCRETEPFAHCDAILAPDRFEARSSLTGIHAGLSAMSASHAFVCACDAPFVQRGLAQMLLEAGEPDDDVVIPKKADGYMEPLCAVYSRRCIKPIHAQLSRADFKIIRFFDEVRVRTVDAETLRRADPELKSFINVNTPEELADSRSRT